MSKITVYAIAWGGKFIGTGQAGLARLTVTDSHGNPVIGVKDVPINQGGSGDGSGYTPDIMKSIPWGTPVNKKDAYSYTFIFESSQPMQLTFKVDVYHYGVLVATASSQQIVWPGLDLTDARSVVVVVPGLLSNIATKVLHYQQSNPIAVNVYMMCGCEIDNHYWPGDHFKVHAVISNTNGQPITSIPLIWSSLATFSGSWTPRSAENVLIQSFAEEIINGNTACSAPTTVPVIHV